MKEKCALILLILAKANMSEIKSVMDPNDLEKLLEFTDTLFEDNDQLNDILEKAIEEVLTEAAK